MRMVFGLVGLLVTLAIVAVLARQQMAATRTAVPSQATATGLHAPAPGASAASVRDQSQHMQQQIKQQMDGLMQQARPMPDDESK